MQKGEKELAVELAILAIEGVFEIDEREASLALAKKFNLHEQGRKQAEYLYDIYMQLPVDWKSALQLVRNYPRFVSVDESDVAEKGYGQLMDKSKYQAAIDLAKEFGLRQELIQKAARRLHHKLTGDENFTEARRVADEYGLYRKI